MNGRKEALHFERNIDNRVTCRLCPHECRIEEGGSGVCRVRSNIGGTLYAESYGKVSAIAMDPVEKKPLYHFHPGKYLLSIGTIGCSFRCSFCQNYHIAQSGPQDYSGRDRLEDVSPSYLLSLCRQEEDCVGIAYTYNEPNTWYEYVLETARFIKEKGYKNVLATNGYINEKPLLELLPYIDAMNIDVKGFTEDYYKRICGGSLEPVKRTVELAAGCCHVEVTTLVVPGKNDSSEEMEALCSWLASIKADLPLHLSRYFPRYKMQEAATPVETLRRLRETARRYLKYVYVGNLLGEDLNTYCPQCGALLISRAGGIFIGHLDEGACTKCGEAVRITGIFD